MGTDTTTTILVTGTGTTRTGLPTPPNPPLTTATPPPTLSLRPHPAYRTGGMRSIAVRGGVRGRRSGGGRGQKDRGRGTM